MKILFVCSKNNGRSQIAKGIYNKLSNTNDADSAGITVNEEGQILADRAKEPGSLLVRAIQAMNEIGVDMSHYRRRQLTPEMIKIYDRVILILEEHEIPDPLRNNPKIENWYISDPKTRDLKGVRETRDLIKEKILQLL